MTDKLCLKFCQHFRGELAVLRGEPDFADVKLETYPAICEHPQKDSAWQQMAAAQAKPDEKVIFVGACFLGSDPKTPAVENLEIVKLDQCFYLFAGQSLVRHYMQQGAYLLTPGWLENWRSRIKQWGFDQSVARQFFGESTTGLVLLDTGVKNDSMAQLQDLSEYLDLPAERLPVGLDHFRLSMQKLVQDWRQEQGSRELAEAITLANQKTADYSMAFELLANLTSMRTEAEVIQGILGTFSMLFAAKRLVYIPIVDGRLGAPQTGQVSDIDLAAMQIWLDSASEEYTWLLDDKGFRLKLTFQGTVTGLLEVAEMAFPKYQHKYLNLALVMTRLSSMAVVNARMFQKIQEAADTDELTGLTNRRFFFHVAEKEFKRAERYGRPVSVVMFDVDHFKQVNDSCGHVTGDKLLVALTNRCRNKLRAVDILSRYGGDEYIILLPEQNSYGASQLADRLRQEIAAAPFKLDGHTLDVTISMGIATSDSTYTSLDQLIRRCDEALYQAKAEGRNRVNVWVSSKGDVLERH